MAEIEKAYELLRKKHNLPAFSELDGEFEISTIESDVFLLREIRRKIAEKLDEILTLLEEILQPDTHTSSMYEAGVFDEEEKKQIFALYRNLMHLKRMGNDASISNNDRQDAEFINKVFSSFDEIKKKSSELIKKLKDSWLEDMETKADLPYFG